MNKQLTFDFEVDKQNKTISIRRKFDAALPLVWDAYTKSDLLDKWWAPKPWKTKTKEMDFREGGKWIYAMVGPKGEEHWAVANYIKILPQKRFTGLDAFSDADGNVNKEMPQSKWEVNFKQEGEETLVEIYVTYNDLSQLEETLKMGFQDGMRIAMEGLDELLQSSR